MLRLALQHPQRALAITVSALVLIVVSVLAHLDPVTQVFTWFVGAASVGIVVLMTVTSAAVVVYFRRTRFDTRLWHTVIAPGLGFIGLAVLLAGAFLGGAAVAVLRPHAGHQDENPDITKEIAR